MRLVSPSAQTRKTASVVYSAPEDFSLLSMRWNSPVCNSPKSREPLPLDRGTNSAATCPAGRRRASVRCGVNVRFRRESPSVARSPLDSLAPSERDCRRAVNAGPNNARTFCRSGRSRVRGNRRSTGCAETGRPPRAARIESSFSGVGLPDKLQRDVKIFGPHPARLLCG